MFFIEIDHVQSENVPKRLLHPDLQCLVLKLCWSRKLSDGPFFVGDGTFKTRTLIVEVKNKLSQLRSKLGDTRRRGGARQKAWVNREYATGHERVKTSGERSLDTSGSAK